MEDQNFNTWQYWREPLPEIEIETCNEETIEIKKEDSPENEATTSEDKLVSIIELHINIFLFIFSIRNFSLMF